METIKGVIGGVGVIIWGLAGPITYIILVVDTWTGRSSVFVKLLLNLTLDAILAVIWPITWGIWLFQYFAGHDSPLSRVLGF
ncbi:hypothetical protein ACSBOB_20345 [Mesorhizobium sp. ASY16-5R]|uniref:hypothetical protein n=1 Tax=Mesorhizobium sp. ASY16-5R TaxID=3445772 RepID=UPI003F9FD27C